MKLLGQKRTTRIFKTFHGRFRIFIFDKDLIDCFYGKKGKYLVIYNNPSDEGDFINRIFQYYLIWFRGYELEHWGSHSSRTLVKKLKINIDNQ